MISRPKASVGDLFVVPLPDSSFGLGVVASKWNAELYLVLFERRLHEMAEAQEVDVPSLNPLFASSSLDAKLWHGHWPIVRRGVDVSGIVQPIYKIEEPAGMMAETFDRRSFGLISPEIAHRLNYRKGVAPVRLERALLANFGHGEWDAMFDELRYERVLASRAALSL